MSGAAEKETLPRNYLMVNDYVQIAYGTARFLNSRNPGFIIGTGLFKESVDLLVPGASTLSVNERLSLYNDIKSDRTKMPAGAVKVNREIADIFWFVSVYFESHLGVPFRKVLGGHETFHDYQLAFSDRRINADEYENIKSEIISLIDKIGQQYILSDGMGHRKKHRLGQKMLPTVRELLDLLVILSVNTSRLFGTGKFDLNGELATSLLNNKEKKQKGHNFNIISEDLKTNGTYSKNAQCLRGSKDIIPAQNDAWASFEIVDLDISTEPTQAEQLTNWQISQGSFGIKTRPIISIFCILLS